MGLLVVVLGPYDVEVDAMVSHTTVSESQLKKSESGWGLL